MDSLGVLNIFASNRASMNGVITRGAGTARESFATSGPGIKVYHFFGSSGILSGPRCFAIFVTDL
jgi:hypothetical protein